MTIKVKFTNGVFEPIEPTEDLKLKAGCELEIQIIPQEKRDKLKGIVGLFSDLSDAQIEKFEQAAKRRPLFEPSNFRQGLQALS